MVTLYSCIVYIKTDDICKDIAQGVETRFDSSNYELNRPKREKQKNLLDELKMSQVRNGDKMF